MTLHFLSGAEIAGDPILLEKFIADILQTDWLCYEKKSDRVTYQRLKTVVTIFPAGFTIWYDGEKIIGYSGWFPIDAQTFSSVTTKPDQLTTREYITPLPNLVSDCAIYIFNYSVIPDYRKTKATRELINHLSHELKKTGVTRLAAIILSEDGARVAERFGLHYQGEFLTDGAPEKIYATTN